MIKLVSEMVGCLIVAAGIGVLVGWLLRQLSVRTLNQHIYDITTALQTKEQALNSAQLELKAKTSTMQIYESKITSSETLLQMTQDELAARTERLTQVQADLSAAIQRIATMESEHSESLHRFTNSDAIIAAFEQEARQANAARTAAQQALSLKEDELFELQNRLAEAETTIKEMEDLKSQIGELEPAQGRVHWLEVQLSEKEAQFRTALHESEEQRASLARRVSELETLEKQIADQKQALRDWGAKQGKAFKQHESDAKLIETQRGAIQDLQATLTERDRTIHQQTEQIGALQRQFDELSLLHNTMTEKSSDRPKRPVEVRTPLKIKGEADTVARRQEPEGDDQLRLEIGRAKSPGEQQRDDLTKIRGINPAVEKALNKLGTHTYIQIARWTVGDMSRVAKQLATPLDRIKRDNWIAAAKKQHREKYGESL